MEAMVAERGTEVTEWNDGRLDDLSERADRIEKKMDAGFARLDKKMDDGFARVDMRLDALNGVMIRSMWTFGVGMLTFAGALLGIIADK